MKRLLFPLLCLGLSMFMFSSCKTLERKIKHNNNLYKFFYPKEFENLRIDNREYDFFDNIIKARFHDELDPKYKDYKLLYIVDTLSFDNPYMLTYCGHNYVIDKAVWDSVKVEPNLTMDLFRRTDVYLISKNTGIDDFYASYYLNYCPLCKVSACLEKRKIGKYPLYVREFKEKDLRFRLGLLCFGLNSVNLRNGPIEYQHINYLDRRVLYNRIVYPMCDCLPHSSPTFEDVSVKYVVTNDSTSLQMVELMPDGHFILTSSGDDELAHFNYGKYYILGIKPIDSFRLRGYEWGLMELKALGEDTYSLKFDPTFFKRITATVRKCKAVEDGTQTNRLVGTWQVSALQIKLERNGDRFFWTGKAGEWEVLDKELRAWVKRFEGDVDETWLNNFINDVVEKYKYAQMTIAFTRFGTYLFVDEKVRECAWWKWQDERQGLLQIFNTEQDLHEDKAARFFRISFPDSLLTIEQEQQNTFFSEALTYYCETMKPQE